MREASWDECIEFNNAVKVSRDKPKARSLIETAEGRIDFLAASKPNEQNINFIFEGNYASALEMLHAFILLNGYKITNHICLGYYLKEVLKRNDLYRIFDDARIKRNNLIYYGKKLDFDSAKESINRVHQLIKELRNLLKKELM